MQYSQGDGPFCTHMSLSPTTSTPPRHISTHTTPNVCVLILFTITLPTNTHSLSSPSGLCASSHPRLYPTPQIRHDPIFSSSRPPDPPRLHRPQKPREIINVLHLVHILFHSQTSRCNIRKATGRFVHTYPLSTHHLTLRFVPSTPSIALHSLNTLSTHHTNTIYIPPRPSQAF
jgi:hypothetical protein